MLIWKVKKSKNQKGLIKCKQSEILRSSVIEDLTIVGYTKIHDRTFHNLTSINYSKLTIIEYAEVYSRKFLQYFVLNQSFP